jgi:CRP-like cAMP-binding protein
LLLKDPILNNLHAAIDAIAEISDENWEILSTCITVIKIPKGEFLIKTGEVCDAVFFLHKGYCRAFLENDGTEVNINFFFEKEFITNIKSFTKKEKSEYAVQARENLIMVKIKKNKLIEQAEQANTKLLEFENFARKMLESMVMKQEEHINLLKLNSAKQRYEYIEKNKPEILQRVPLTQIASYLSVTRETLTRIRKKKLAKI